MRKHTPSPLMFSELFLTNARNIPCSRNRHRHNSSNKSSNIGSSNGINIYTDEERKVYMYIHVSPLPFLALR